MYVDAGCIYYMSELYVMEVLFLLRQWLCIMDIECIGERHMCSRYAVRVLLMLY